MDAPHIPPLDAEPALAEVRARREQVVGSKAFTLVVVGAGLSLAVTLEARGVPWPATIACVPVALALAAGGPMLMACLRRLMLSRPIAGAR